MGYTNMNVILIMLFVSMTGGEITGPGTPTTGT